MSVTIEGDRMRVGFADYGPAAYQEFLAAKRLPEYEIVLDADGIACGLTAPARLAAMMGVEGVAPPAAALPYPDCLFGDQVAALDAALAAKRFAYWADCGLGKTLVALEWARQVAARTGGRVLGVTMHGVLGNFAEQWATFYPDEPPLRILRTRAEMRRWCAGDAGDERIAVTNYEKLNPGKTDDDGQVVREWRSLAGVLLDESSRLKTGGGKQKWAIIKSSKGLEYKLSLTATPAPNDLMEFASQASFLERMRSEGEILWTYFARDKQTKEWTVKRHAREAFFEFLASWSMYVRDPRRYGWRPDWEGVPEPIIETVEVPQTDAQRDAARVYTAEKSGQSLLFADDAGGIVERGKLAQIARGFVYGADRKPNRIDSNKPGEVARMAAAAVVDGPVLIWTTYNEESAIVGERLAAAGVDHRVLTGSVPKKKREAIVDTFVRGGMPVLVARAKMLGFGVNFQHVRTMIFSGFDDSYESFYQALRRAYRYGQTEALKVLIPVVRDLEGDMLENILAKAAKHEAAVSAMEDAYIKARERLKGDM